MSDSNLRALVYEKLQTGSDIARHFEARGITAVLPFGGDSCLRRHQPISEDEIVELAAGFSAIVGASGAQITARVLERLPELKVVSKIGIGYEVIDIEAATRLGIQVTNTPSEVEIDAVAEHSVALMLAAAKRLHYYTLQRMAAGDWLNPDVKAVFLKDKTVGIVGFGRIGRAVAARLQGWGVRVLACDLPGRVIAAEDGVTVVELGELLSESDFISLHLSAAMGSLPVIGAAEMALLKPSCILINTSRGRNIDQGVLYHALSTDRLAVAALDVFDPEPPVLGERLLQLPNILVTPHLAGVTPESEADMEFMAVENVHSVLEGRVPPALVNREVLTSTAFRGIRPLDHNATGARR